MCPPPPPRYLWGENNGHDILAVVLKELKPELDSGRVVTQLSSRVTELFVSERGNTAGVRAQTPNGERVFCGRHVLITTGGYANNPEMFQELIGQPTYMAGTYPTNLGKGLELALSVGGTLRGHELHRSGTGSILDAGSYPTRVFARFETVPQTRLPWEIWVNNEGRQFIREDESLQETHAAVLAEQGKFRYAIVFDSEIFESSPPGIPGWSREQMYTLFNTHPMFHMADSLDQLVEMAEISASGLRRSVRDYNKSVEKGSDDLGRSYFPRKTDEAPYYAIVHHGHSVTSSIGITVDDDFRVVRENGEPIKNLYAAGEVLGIGVSLGAVFTPGMMLTPALTIGRELGRKLPIRSA